MPLRTMKAPILPVAILRDRSLRDAPQDDGSCLIIKHLRRHEPAELALDQLGQLQGVRSSSHGPTICTPTGSPSGAKPVGIAVEGRPGSVAMPGQASWSG